MLTEEQEEIIREWDEEEVKDDEDDFEWSENKEEN